jgi:hypothetical protein
MFMGQMISPEMRYIKSNEFEGQAKTSLIAMRINGFLQLMILVVSPTYRN